MGYVPSSEALPWLCCDPCEPPSGSTAAPGPAGPPPPPPDEGAGARTGPPKGIAPCCSCSPPTLQRQTLSWRSSSQVRSHGTSLGGFTDQSS